MAAKKRSNTRTKTAANSAAVAKRAQPQGGALAVRGMLGNAGGPGRPPEALRVSSREMFDALLAEVRRRLKTGALAEADLTQLSQLLNTFGKYGIGTQDTLTVVSPDVLARLERQVMVIHREVPDAEIRDRLLAALTAEVWTAT